MLSNLCLPKVKRLTLTIRVLGDGKRFCNHSCTKTYNRNLLLIGTSCRLGCLQFVFFMESINWQDIFFWLWVEGLVFVCHLQLHGFVGSSSNTPRCLFLYMYTTLYYVEASIRHNIIYDNKICAVLTWYHLMSFHGEY